jgi:hypothetical protein
MANEPNNRLITVDRLQEFLTQLLGDGNTIPGKVYKKAAINTLLAGLALKNGNATEYFNTSSLHLHGTINGGDREYLFDVIPPGMINIHGISNYAQQGAYIPLDGGTVLTDVSANQDLKADCVIVGSNDAFRFATTLPVAVFKPLGISTLSNAVVLQDGVAFTAETTVSLSTGDVVYVNGDINDVTYSGFYYVEELTTGCQFTFISLPSRHGIYYKNTGDSETSALCRWTGTFTTIASGSTTTVVIEGDDEDYELATVEDITGIFTDV